MLEILGSAEWDVRIVGDEYREKDFTGREETLDRCYFNRRPHEFSSSELRRRVANEHKNDSRMNRVADLQRSRA